MRNGAHKRQSVARNSSGDSSREGNTLLALLIMVVVVVLALGIGPAIGNVCSQLRNFPPGFTARRSAPRIPPWARFRLSAAQRRSEWTPGAWAVRYHRGRRVRLGRCNSAQVKALQGGPSMSETTEESDEPPPRPRPAIQYPEAGFLHSPHCHGSLTEF